MLSARGPGLFPSVVSGPVFTPDDIFALNDGEVLTSDPDSFSNAVVASLEDFEQLVEDGWCELE